MPMNKLRS